MKNKNKKTGNSMFVFLLLFIIIAFCFLFVYFRTQQTIRFDMIQGPITNPLMGWVPWATIEESEQPFTLVYADLTWRELEPQEGRFDFESFETRNQFERWRAEGKKVVFRFVLDRPDSEEHLDIPDWLYDKIAGDGDFYNHDYGKGFSPNYANQVLIAYH
ncbi:MAG: DUF4832 domain-containing protein, partial [Ignavibacteria bacterium]|nr:DUF4832 domain-containing protein [Ignavibacteria bacterium]